jgi:hypothetical protein
LLIMLVVALRLNCVYDLAPETKFFNILVAHHASGSSKT